MEGSRSIAQHPVEASHVLSALRRHRPGVRRVDDLKTLSGGASQEIWSLRAEGEEGALDLVLRRARPWSDSGQAGSAGMAAEAALLSAAATGGVPVPEVVGVLHADDGLGEGYFMTRVPGESSARAILRDAAYAPVRPRLAADCGALMARIHALPAATLPPLREGRARVERERWQAAHRANGVARPVFEYALRWLARHEPADAGEPPSVLVHGDFRNGNLLVDPTGVRAVLDWELAHRGDPMEDLGWFCVNAWRFGEVDRPAGGLGSREQLFAGYEAAGGCAVDPARVRWWQVLGTLKWGVTCDAMGLAWRSGADRSIERLAVARRVGETEMDLLALVAPQGRARSAETAPDAADADGGNSVPPASDAEILQALDALLREQAHAPEADISLRIGVSLIQMLQRERLSGPALAREEGESLQGLLGSAATEQLGVLREQLCERIAGRNPALDDEQLVAHLWRVTRARLAIDQPRYRWAA
ncbi:MAG: phosphotransferase family protein [Burkholderiales bacterium]|nr:phosphotransferase family protein [Burkholderiales bacterium]